MTLPTKSDLLQNSIVTIDRQHKKVITNSIQVADYFGKRPSNVNQRISSLVKRGRLKIKPSYYLNQQGKEQKYYELNRDQFLLVVMGFTGDKADQFKADFITLFNQMESENIYWLQQRHLSTDATKLANESIHLLREKLLLQYPDSKTGTFAFQNIQGAICKTATGNYRLKRDDMNQEQLSAVILLESEVNAFIDNHKSNDAMTIFTDVLAMIKKEAPASEQTKRGLDNAA